MTILLVHLQLNHLISSLLVIVETAFAMRDYYKWPCTWFFIAWWQVLPNFWWELCNDTGEPTLTDEARWRNGTLVETFPNHHQDGCYQWNLYSALQRFTLGLVTLGEYIWRIPDTHTKLHELAELKLQTHLCEIYLELWNIFLRCVL